MTEENKTVTEATTKTSESAAEKDKPQSTDIVASDNEGKDKTNTQGRTEQSDAEVNQATSKHPAPKDESAPKTPKKKKVAAQKTPSTSGRLGWLAVLALMLTVAVGYGVYYNHQQVLETQLVANQADQALGRNHANLSEKVDTLQQQLGQAREQNQQLLASLNDSAKQRQSIQQAIDNLSEQLAKKGRGPLQWRVAEVDYLLTIANHRLILQRDVVTAAKALADADERLQSISDPGLIPVRQKIAAEIAALNAVELPDVAGMAAKLSGLVDSIERLPLINKERVFDREKTEEGPVSDWQQLPAAMWQDIKRLVTIRHNQKPVERLLPPEEIHYLYQNLALKLEEARIALLQQQTAIFQRHMSDTQVWITQYFDPESAAVTHVLTDLEGLANQELRPALPDVSASLRTLREWSDEQQQRVSVVKKTPKTKTTPIKATVTKAAPTRATATRATAIKTVPKETTAAKTAAPVMIPAETTPVTTAPTETTSTRTSPANTVSTNTSATDSVPTDTSSTDASKTNASKTMDTAASPEEAVQ
jgi:uroporphyrin-III C-methyltransferase